MSDFAAFAHGSIEALRDAEAQHAAVAATFLRVQVPALIRECRALRQQCAETQRLSKQKCDECEHAPHDAPITTRHYKHG